MFNKEMNIFGVDFTVMDIDYFGCYRPVSLNTAMQLLSEEGYITEKSNCRLRISPEAFAAWEEDSIAELSDSIISAVMGGYLNVYYYYCYVDFYNSGYLMALNGYKALKALISYCNNEFALCVPNFPEYDGKYFNDLPETVKKDFANRSRICLMRAGDNYTREEMELYRAKEINLTA